VITGRGGGATPVTPVPGDPGVPPAARPGATATGQQAARRTAPAMSGHPR
jgi:hypothetical protein